MNNAYCQGSVAFSAGFDRSDNPFPAGTVCAALWDKGYSDAESALYDAIASKREHSGRTTTR